MQGAAYARILWTGLSLGGFAVIWAVAAAIVQ